MRSLSFSFPSARLLPLAALALLLTACETPLNDLRAQRFDAGTPTRSATVAPQALAQALQANPDGQSLSPSSIQAANALLTRQGRIGDQVLTLTPFNTRGEQLAPRIAQALVRSGAQPVRIGSLPADPALLAQAQAAGWDLELLSEAMTVETDRCGINNDKNWTIHPFYGLGGLGCANRANIARMAADPRDLQRPRTLEPGDGRAAAAAIKRYQDGEIRDLIDIDFEE